MTTISPIILPTVNPLEIASSPAEFHGDHLAASPSHCRWAQVPPRCESLGLCGGHLWVPVGTRGAVVVSNLCLILTLCGCMCVWLCVCVCVMPVSMQLCEYVCKYISLKVDIHSICT